MGAGVIRIRDWGTSKKIWKRLSIISIFVFVVLSVFSFFYVRDTNNKMHIISAKNDVDNVTLNDYTTKITNENIKNLEKVFNSTFTVDQMAEMAAKNFTYVMTINGKIQENSNEAYISSSQLVIGLSESIAENKLPSSILDLGRISIDKTKGDDFASNITISAKDKKFEKTKNIKNGITTVFFTCKDLKVGDIVTIFFSDELVKRMGLTDNYVEVFYNK